MISLYTMYTSLLFLFLTVTLSILLQKKKNHRNLPPSPLGLPLLGHLHLLKQPIHRTLHVFSLKYGPVFSLRFGSRLVVVVSSPSAVEECFNKHDVVLANRPEFISGKYLGYGNTTLGTAPYGDHWRNLRRICTLEIFSTTRLNLSSPIRRAETNALLRKLHRLAACGFARVELKSLFLELTFNTIMRLLAGKRYYGEDVSEVEEAEDFKDLISESFALATYAGDFLPFYEWFDFNGYLKKLKKLSIRSDKFLQGLIDEHRRKGRNPNTVVGHLLSLQESQPEYYSDETIKGLVGTMISAGTETSAVTIEWAMSNLLNQPQELEKAKAEIDSKIGAGRLLEESDLAKLPHLQNIITETLRLYPAAPLLAPHFSSEDCAVGGYTVPAGTIVFVNAWAIQRDPKVWEDAGSFKPARFEGVREAEGYRLLPFGLGRRACPGMGLANRTTGVVLGSLIQCFDWKRVGEKEIDMKEGQGASMPKVEPLEALCRTRSRVIDRAMVQEA